MILKLCSPYVSSKGSLAGAVGKTAGRGAMLPCTMQRWKAGRGWHCEGEELSSLSGWTVGSRSQGTKMSRRQGRRRSSRLGGRDDPGRAVQHSRQWVQRAQGANPPAASSSHSPHRRARAPPENASRLAVAVPEDETSLRTRRRRTDGCPACR